MPGVFFLKTQFKGTKWIHMNIYYQFLNFLTKHLEEMFQYNLSLLIDTILLKRAMFSAKKSSDLIFLDKSAELACAMLLPLVS